MKTFEEKDCVVLGVSMDPVDSHKKWCEKIKLPYDLLADTEKTVHKAYGFDAKARALFLIDKKGTIVFANRKYDLKPDSFKALLDAVGTLAK